MINTKSEIEHRTKELSLCSTVSPVALSATNGIQPSKARSSLVKVKVDNWVFIKINSSRTKILGTA